MHLQLQFEEPINESGSCSYKQCACVRYRAMRPFVIEHAADEIARGNIIPSLPSIRRRKAGKILALVD